jgi:hypothetical protein
MNSPLKNRCFAERQMQTGPYQRWRLRALRECGPVLEVAAFRSGML